MSTHPTLRYSESELPTLERRIVLADLALRTRELLSVGNGFHPSDILSRSRRNLDTLLAERKLQNSSGPDDIDEDFFRE